MPRGPVAQLAICLLAFVASGCSLLGIGGEPVPAPDPPFFRVEAENGRSLFVLGSIHVGPPSGWSLPPHIEAAFEGARTAVFEFVPDANPSAQARRIHEITALPLGETLAGRLGPELYEQLEQRFRELGAERSLAGLRGRKPWFAYLELARAESTFLDYHGRTGVDFALTERTEQATDPPRRIGIETAEEQLGVLDALSISEQRGILQHALDDSEAQLDVLRRLIAAWKIGDEEALASLRELPEDTPDAMVALNEALFTARDERMAQTIATLLDGPYPKPFVTIGAGHLYGKDSVLARLEAAGYRVERLHAAPDPAGAPGRNPADRFSGGSAFR